MHDFGPMRRIFTAIYALGVRVVVARMAKHAAVHSISGWGSYFAGTHLAGQSDVDMGIVIGKDYSRNEGAHHDVARCYNRWRRVFPFLGGWDEKEGSLIFLEEASSGFPVLASFRVKTKQGRIRRLYGEPFPIDLGDGPATDGEIVEEIDTLLRIAVLKGEEHSRRLLFWKRLFTKLLVLIGDLRLADLADEARVDPRLAFLNEADRRLYWRKGDADKLFSAFVELVKRTCHAVKDRDDLVTLTYKPGSDNGMLTESKPSPLDPLLVAAGVRVKELRLFSSGPVGVMPHLYYFAIDQQMPVVELEGCAYGELRKLLRSMRRDKATGRAYLVRAEGLLFIVADEETYVDVVPLDPLIYANVYARLGGELSCQMPRSVYDQQRRDAEQTFAGLRANYGDHDGWLTKYSYPCIFREDDADTLRDTFEFLRSYVAHADGGLYIGSTDRLVDYLKRRHPECTGFLTDLSAYCRYLGNGRSGPQPANNLFRCLHQFVSQLLGGASTIAIDPHQDRLGITVGIITRNRASDLKHALESLTRQLRSPDEVVLVDNGSTDDTKAVVESFNGRLPVKYLHLADASIPLARNMVVEHATQEIIAFTDDDCGIPPEWLGSIERGFLRAKNIGIVGGWIEHWPAERDTTVDAYFSIFHSHKT